MALAALAFAPRSMAQDRPPARVPFEIIKGKVFVDILIGGRPVQAMVDTGAALSGLDAAFAASIGIRGDGASVSLRNVQGASSGRWSKAVAVSVGSYSETRALLVADFGLLTSTVLHPIRALLGADFLSQFVVEFDFDAGAMTLHPPAAFAPPPAPLISLAPMRRFGRTPLRTAPLLIEGRAIQALIDTGSQSALIVSPGVARQSRLTSNRTVSTTTIGSFGGPSTGKITHLDSLEIGGKRFADVPVQIASRDLGAQGNVGLDLLSRFHLWLDLGGGRMWLAPRSGQPPFPRDLLGFFGVQDGDTDLRITFVAQGSPAERAGLKTGDIVSRINGEPAIRAHLALVGATEGTRLNLTLQSGAAHTVVLGRYY